MPKLQPREDGVYSARRGDYGKTLVNGVEVELVEECKVGENGYAICLRPDMLAFPYKLACTPPETEIPRVTRLGRVEFIPQERRLSFPENLVGNAS